MKFGAVDEVHTHERACHGVRPAEDVDGAAVGRGQVGIEHLVVFDAVVQVLGQRVAGAEIGEADPDPCRVLHLVVGDAVVRRAVQVDAAAVGVVRSAAHVLDHVAVHGLAVAAVLDLDAGEGRVPDEVVRDRVVAGSVLNHDALIAAGEAVVGDAVVARPVLQRHAHAVAGERVARHGDEGTAIDTDRRAGAACEGEARQGDVVCAGDLDAARPELPLSSLAIGGLQVSPALAAVRLRLAMYAPPECHDQIRRCLRAPAIGVVLD